MRVAVFVPGGLDPEGREAIPCVQWLLSRLAQRHDVHVFALRPKPQPPAWTFAGAAVHNVAGWGGGRCIRAVLAEHRRRRFDVLHAFWLAPEGVIAGLLGRALNVPVITHLGGGELLALPDIAYGGRTGLRGHARGWLALRLATRVTAASTPARDTVQRAGATAELVPLGVDLEAWPPPPVRKRTPTVPARLVHVGSLNPVKDQTTLLRAARVLKDSGYPFHLDLIGADTLDGRIHRLCRELDLGSETTFHGFLLRESLQPLVAGADLMLLSSRYEAGPVAVLEAAVCGVPTVGTAVGHVRDWAPEAAVAVPIGEPRALAMAVMELLDDECRRMRLAHEAQRRAIHWDADWTATRFESFYRSVVGV